MMIQGGVNSIPIIGRGWGRSGAPSVSDVPVYFNELWMPHTNAYSFVETPSSAFSPVYTYIDDEKEVILMKVQTNGDSLSGLKLAPGNMVVVGSSIYPVAPQAVGRDSMFPHVDKKSGDGFEKIDVGAWPDFTNMYLYAYNSVSTDLEYIGYMPVNNAPTLSFMNYRSPYDLNNMLNLGIPLNYWGANSSIYGEFETAFSVCYNNYNNPDKPALTYYVTATNNYASYNNVQVNGAQLTAEMFASMTNQACRNII